MSLNYVQNSSNVCMLSACFKCEMCARIYLIWLFSNRFNVRRDARDFNYSTTAMTITATITITTKSEMHGIDIKSGKNWNDENSSEFFQSNIRCTRDHQKAANLSKSTACLAIRSSHRSSNVVCTQVDCV